MNFSKSAILFLVLLGMFASRTQAQQTFFEDQFNGSSLDTTTKWSFYGAATDSLGNATGGDGNVGAVTGADINKNGGTNFGFKPIIQSDADGTRYARLRLDTYNPRDTTRLKGTEMYSRMGFGPPGRVRLSTPTIPLIVSQA